MYSISQVFGVISISFGVDSQGYGVNSKDLRLGITKRFVGTEPFCAVTRAYNERMKQILPKYGVEVIEIPRIGGISASLVRKAMAEGNLELVSKIVPETTMEYIRAEN